MSWSNRQDRPRPGTEEAPAHLDRYELIGELGQGGMSVVFRARDKQLGRDVAVKLLHDFLARQEDARKRFHREAVAVARLRHPGIVEIYDYSGPEAEDAYIVCEIIDGETLREHMEGQDAPAHPEFGVMVIQELVRALRHAHEQGIVHRDVKPENIMITRRGQLKLMDFGIAQIMEGATKLTATGTLLGSPAHMAPEVIDGKPSDHRSDIFSVGTMLFWLATGQMPFQAPNPSALFRLILEGTYEPPQMLNPRIGNGLARIIEHALEPDPEARYQDISELQVDLQAELDEVGLQPSDSLVKRYLSDPTEFTAEWSDRIVATLVERGQAALADGNTGRAMDRFNRVLAVNPEHPDVSRMVSRIGRRQALNRRAKRGAVFLSAAAVVGLLVYNEARIWPGDTEAAAPATAAVTAAAPALAPVEAGPPAPPVEASAPAVKPAPAPKTRIKSPGRRVRPRSPTVRAMVRSPEGQPTASPVAAAKTSGTPTKVPNPSLAGATPAEVAPSSATLVVAIGGGWGNVKINGKLRRKGGYGGEFALEPGRYRVEVGRQDGQHAPRVVEVQGGRLFVIKPDGARSPLPKNELRFRMPGRGETVDGWIPNAEEARAPSPDRGT